METGIPGIWRDIYLVLHKDRGSFKNTIEMFSDVVKHHAGDRVTGQSAGPGGVPEAVQKAWASPASP